MCVNIIFSLVQSGWAHRFLCVSSSFPAPFLCVLVLVEFTRLTKSKETKAANHFKTFCFSQLVVKFLLCCQKSLPQLTYLKKIYFQSSLRALWKSRLHFYLHKYRLHYFFFSKELSHINYQELRGKNANQLFVLQSLKSKIRFLEILDAVYYMIFCLLTKMGYSFNINNKI